MSLLLIGGGLILIHSICYTLLPKKYWGKDDEPAKKEDEE